MNKKIIKEISLLIGGFLIIFCYLHFIKNGTVQVSIEAATIILAIFLILFKGLPNIIVFVLKKISEKSKNNLSK